MSKNDDKYVCANKRSLLLQVMGSMTNSNGRAHNNIGAGPLINLQMIHEPLLLLLFGDDDTFISPSQMFNVFVFCGQTINYYQDINNIYLISDIISGTLQKNLEKKAVEIVTLINKITALGRNKICWNFVIVSS